MAFVKLKRQEFSTHMILTVGSTSLKSSHVYLCVPVFLCFFPRINIWDERPSCLSLHGGNGIHGRRPHTCDIFFGDLLGNTWESSWDFYRRKMDYTKSFSPLLNEDRRAVLRINKNTYLQSSWLVMFKSSSCTGTSTVLGLRPWKKNLPGNLKIGCSIPEWLSSESKKERPARSRECGPTQLYQQSGLSLPSSLGSMAPLCT